MRRALLLILLLAGCSRPAAPSPEYAEARRRHAEVVAAHPADAAARPEMGAVLDLLARVPPGSPDAPAAAELRARIEEERGRLVEEAARRDALAASAARPPPMPPDASPPGASAPAAQPGSALRLQPGLALEAFREQAGDCFEKKTDLEIVEDTRTRAGEAWALRAVVGCAERHPAYVGQYVLFADGAYVSTRPQVEAQRVERKLPAPAATGSAPAVAAPGPASTPPAPAPPPAAAPTGAPR
jgi:hypothetical protein